MGLGTAVGRGLRGEQFVSQSFAKYEKLDITQFSSALSICLTASPDQSQKI
jgi:hypothetical protein